MEAGDKIERIRDTLRKAARELALLKGDFDNDDNARIYDWIEESEDSCDAAAEKLGRVQARFVDAVLLADGNGWYSQVQLDELAER